jgi:hypothetical protein
VLGPLILLRAGGVIAGEVKIAEGSTRSGHHLLEVLLILVPEAVLLLALALVAGVIPVVVVVLVGVELLPLGAVGDEVGGIAALEAAPRRPLPLLVESVQSTELPRQQGDLIIGDALVLFIRSCTQGRHGTPSPSGFEAKPVKTARVVLRPNHSQTVDPGFKAQPRNPCSKSPRARCRPHTAPPDLSTARPPST